MNFRKKLTRQGRDRFSPFGPPHQPPWLVPIDIYTIGTSLTKILRSFVKTRLIMLIFALVNVRAQGLSC
jgi:hypothetical protein